jgi:hypothetical protein
MIGVCINCSAVFKVRTRGFSKTQNPMVILFWKRKFKPKRAVGGFFDLEIFQKPGINQRL